MAARCCARRANGRRTEECNAGNQRVGLVSFPDRLTPKSRLLRFALAERAGEPDDAAVDLTRRHSAWITAQNALPRSRRIWMARPRLFCVVAHVRRPSGTTGRVCLAWAVLDPSPGIFDSLPRLDGRCCTPATTPFGVAQGQCVPPGMGKTSVGKTIDKSRYREGFARPDRPGRDGHQQPDGGATNGAISRHRRAAPG